jgi:hypothetical protein
MIGESPVGPEQAPVAERWSRSRLQTGATMASDRSSTVHEDLDPRATRALGAAYDLVLQSITPQAPDTCGLLRDSLARYLVSIAFGGDRDPDILRERAIAYVARWSETRTPSEEFGRMRGASRRSVTRIELGEILLAEAQKAVPAHSSYPGHVNVYAVPHMPGLGPNWTIQGFTPWTSDTEKCRQSLGAAERELKNGYRVG